MFTRKLYALVLFNAVLVQSIPLCNNYTAPQQSLVWQPCTQKGYEGVECAKFTVPINWEDCSSQRITMTAARVPTNATSRIGSLFLRYGGPGIYTSYTLQGGAAGFDDKIKDYFDLLVLDNRGTGLNYPVSCDLDLWNQDFNLYPQTEDEYQKTMEQYARAGESCVEKTGPVIHYMDALTHAKDLEALRVALDEPLTIYALSWGSQAISQYAETFPDNIRAMILDGNVPHFLSNVEFGLSETAGMALTSQRVLGWASTNESSPLYRQDAVQVFRDVVKRAASKPFHKEECEGSKLCRPEVTASDILGGMEGWSEYPSPELFLSVAECLSELQKGNASCVLTTRWTDETVEATLKSGALPWTQAAIGCQDWKVDHSWAAYRDWDRLTGVQAIPVNKAYHGVIQLVCPGWPTSVTNPPNLQPSEVYTSAPILIVNALWDPASPYNQAVSMHRHFSNSVLLTRNGEGHGSFDLESFPQTAVAMINYLKDPVNSLPKPNTILDQPIGTFDILTKESKR